MTILERKNLKKGQFWKERIRKRTILNRRKMKKDSSEKENLYNDSSGKKF